METICGTLLSTYLSLLVLLLLLTESLLDDLLRDPLPLGDRRGRPWLGRCGDWFPDREECGDRLRLC